MFSLPTASPPSLATTISSPVSPSRPSGSRLRSLSYLRNYTHTHILSRDSNHSHRNSSSNPRPTSLTRATSYPDPTSLPTAPPVSPTNQHSPPRHTSPRAQRATADPLGGNQSTGTSGWLPTVAGQNGAARTGIQPQSTPSDSSSALLTGNSSSVPLDSNIAPAMARTRSATATSTGQAAEITRNQTTTTGNTTKLPSIRFSAHQDLRSARPSLVFSPMARILPTGSETIRVGRYSERDTQPVQAPNVPSSAPVGFKSKVVSRRHCEFWYQEGRWYIKDVKSSSGTFLNHIRLSSPGTESRPFPINDGDIVQLGIDFKGGEEMIFRCVKIRIELNRGWQSGLNNFNVKAHKRLREMSKAADVPGKSSQDCSICLDPIAPCQSLFVAPCSHTWHYKCIRTILNGPMWPHFLCPNCRAVADLEAEVDDPYAGGEWEEDEEEVKEEREAEGTLAPPSSIAGTPLTTPVVIPAPTTSIAPIVEDEPSSSGPSPNSSSDNLSEPTDESVIPSNLAPETIAYLDYGGPAPNSSVDNDSLRPPIASHASSAPIPIKGRKPSAISRTPSTANAPLATDGESSSDGEHGISSGRTPSPTARALGAAEAGTGVDGPMTPRNDAGPFVFDGSGGRASALRAEMGAFNLGAAADESAESEAVTA